MRDPRQALYLVACVSVGMFGFVLALPGTAVGLPEVADRLELTLANRGALIAALFGGTLVGSLVSGPIVDRIGHRAALAVSSALAAICIPLFVLAEAFWPAAASLAVTGFAAAGVNTAANALAADFFPAERGRRANGLAIAFGIGGLSLPTATALLAGVVPWGFVVAAGSLVAAAAAAAALRVPQPELAGVHGERPRFGILIRQRGLLWFCLLIALGAGIEAGMAGFTSTYLVALGFRPEAATWALSFHWIGLIAARLALARRVDRAKRRAIAAAALCGAATTTLFVGASAPLLLAAAPFAIGVAIAVVVPTSLALGAERYPRSAGTLFGVLLTMAQAGAMIIPAVIGIVADAAGVRAAMSVLVVVNLLVAAIGATRR